MDFEAEDRNVVSKINGEAFTAIDAAARKLLEAIDESVFFIVNEDAVHIARITMLRDIVVNFISRGKAKQDVTRM